MDVTSIRVSADAAIKQASVPQQQQAATRRELNQAAAVLNKIQAVGEKNELVFVIDPVSRRAIMQVVDRDTRDVVMQLPPEYVLRLAADARKPGQSF